MPPKDREEIIQALREELAAEGIFREPTEVEIEFEWQSRRTGFDQFLRGLCPNCGAHEAH
jgi:hypothetical protein